MQRQESLPRRWAYKAFYRVLHAVSYVNIPQDAGDFALQGGRVQRPPAGQPRPLTYANLALVRDRLVAGITAGQHAPLGPCLFASAAAGRLGGELLLTADLGSETGVGVDFYQPLDARQRHLLHVAGLQGQLLCGLALPVGQQPRGR